MLSVSTPARERVEAVEDEAHGGMVGPADDLPRVAVVVDEAPPGERLVADAQAPRRGPFAELAEIIRGAIDAAQRDAAKRWSRRA